MYLSFDCCPSEASKGLAYLLHVDFNVFLQAVAVQVQDQIMDKVKAVTDDDQRQLVGQFRFLRREIQITLLNNCAASVAETQDSFYRP